MARLTALPIGMQLAEMGLAREEIRRMLGTEDNCKNLLYL